LGFGLCPGGTEGGRDGGREDKCGSTVFRKEAWSEGAREGRGKGGRESVDEEALQKKAASSGKPAGISYTSTGSNSFMRPTSAYVATGSNSRTRPRSAVPAYVQVAPQTRPNLRDISELDTQGDT